MPEWAVSAGMLGWGILALFAEGLFERLEQFHPLLLIMSQVFWGAVAALIGFIRIVFLIINGAWRPSAHIRAIGCGLGCILWSSLLFATLDLPWLITTTAIHTTLLFIDFFSLWFAAGDAKLADLSVRSLNPHNGNQFNT